MTDNPKISVIVPVYLSENYLVQALDSLVNQTFKDLEIIVINDGSPDDSDKICRDYAGKDKRVIYINKKNEGQAKAWQQGTAMARGEFVAYLDADDWLELDALEYAYDWIVRENADVMFWSRINEFEDKSVPEVPLFSQTTVFSGEKMKWLRRRIVGMLDNETVNPVKTDAVNAAHGKLYRRNIIIDNKIKFYDTFEIGSTDVLFNVHTFQHIDKAIYIHKFFTHYRRYNPNSLTRTYQNTLLTKHLALFGYLREFIEKNNLGKDYRQALYNRIGFAVINNALSIVSPNNNNAPAEKKKHLKTVLTNKVFQEALDNMQTEYLPIYWRIFFTAARNEHASALYYLTKVILKIR